MTDAKFIPGQYHREAPSLDVQFTELAELEDGWFDGDGTAYDPAFLKLARGICDEIVQSVPIPYIYPSLDDEISLEWDNTITSQVVMKISTEFIRIASAFGPVIEFDFHELASGVKHLILALNQEHR